MWQHCDEPTGQRSQGVPAGDHLTQSVAKPLAGFLTSLNTGDDIMLSHDKGPFRFGLLLGPGRHVHRAQAARPASGCRPARAYGLQLEQGPDHEPDCRVCFAVV